MILIQKLAKTHNKKQFDCGQEEINKFLKIQSRQASSKNYSQTFVLVEKSNQTEVIAFYALSLCTVDSSHQHEINKTYKGEMYGLKLVRMGVDLAHQGKSITSHIIIDVMLKAIMVKEAAGIKGVFVDPKNDSLLGLYKKFGFIEIDKNRNNKMWMPIATCESLTQQN